MTEEGNDAHGYAKLGRSRRDNSDYHTRGAFTNLSPPIDAYNAVYLAFVLGGAGFLLPYNSFIMAMDYFKIRYPGTPVVFDMSLVYIAVALLTVLGNNLLVETFTLNSRINFGYIMSFITLIFVVVCEVWWEAFGSATSYTVNLAAVAVVAVGCTVQQSSFYGYTSMLPPKYTQAVMVGESTSGVFTSMVRVLTRFLVKELRGSTIYFFTVSVSSVATCFAMYHLIRRTDFIQFYIALCERAKTRITLEPTEDAGLCQLLVYTSLFELYLHICHTVGHDSTSVYFTKYKAVTYSKNYFKNSTIGDKEIETNDTQYGVLKIQNSPPPSGNNLSFANPAYEPSAPVPTYKVEDVVIRGRQSISNNGVGLSNIKRGIQARWEVTKAIYPYMISICLVYFATLCLYPGIASEVISCHLGTWMPILMMALFNGADLIGKMLASSARYWTGARLVRCSVARLIMIPLMVMCVAPRANPIFSAEITAFTFSLFLGLTNGILGSVPMIQAPTKVDDRHRELTGNMMTLLYMFGLAAGSLVAYSLENILSPVEEHPCGMSDIHVQARTTDISNTSIDSILITTPSTNFITLLSSYVPTVTEGNVSD